MVVASDIDWALGFTSRNLRDPQRFCGELWWLREPAEYTVALEQLDKGRPYDRMLLKRGLMELEKR